MDASFIQDINFKGSDAEYSVGIISQDVRIKCSAGDHDHGSSKMKLTDMVDFNWGLRLCPGHLIAIHRKGLYIAYGLKTKDHGMVRVLNTVTKEKTLIKGVHGLIYDISFAFCTSEVLLGFVDEEGTLYVYEIIEETEKKSELKHKLVVQLATPSGVIRSSNGSSSSSRVSWCPYVPSYGEDEASCVEHSKLLVLLRLGGSVEVLDVGELARCSSDGRYSTPAADASVDGYVRLDECSRSGVVDASFSPDGTALATAGQDGYVKFFQVFLRDGERPRCLHEWRPHDGKALSSLLFLDNVNTYGTDCKFWKFAVTGALNNSELKVWSCETWSCTQTIVFHADPRAASPDLYLKAILDATGTFLVLTETNNRLLYVLQVRRDDNGRQAAVESVAEFLLPSACISFCVRDATLGDSATNTHLQQRHPPAAYLDLDDLDLEADDEDGNLEDGNEVHIHMYLMQTKCLQECRLVFRPEIISALSSDAAVAAANSPSSPVTSCTPPPPSAPVDLKLDDLQTSVHQLIIKQQQHRLHAEGDGDVAGDVAGADDCSAGGADVGSALLLVAETIGADNLLVVADRNDDKIVVVDNLIEIDLIASVDSDLTPTQQQQVVERNFASGGSSPSREVQEILLSLSVSSSSSQSHQQQQQQQHLPNSKQTAAAPYTPKQFFDSLSKLQHQQQQYADNKAATVQSQEWPDIPKVSNIELVDRHHHQQQQQQQRLESRIEALEDALRLHTVQLTADRQQLLSYNSKNMDSIALILAKHEQQISSLLEQHRRHLDTSVQATVAAAMPPPLPARSPQPAAIDSATLAAVVQQELQCIIAPSVQATFEQLHRSLDAQHTQKLAHLDSLVRSNVQRLFAQCSQNKTVAEALSGALVQMVRPGLEAQYRELMATSLVPAWEKVCEAMFHQIHATFTQGTKEYCGAMERYCLEQQRQQQQAQQHVDVAGQQVQAQVSCAFNRLETSLAEVVREEVRAGVKQLQNSALLHAGNTSADNGNDGSSDAGGKRAPTPAVQQLQQQQQQVKRLLQRGGRSAICEAFQIALSAAAAASDTALVLYVCESVPVHEVFCSPTADPATAAEITCILPQHVLLSLIQQLGADLTQHTDLKHRYLEESLLNLDMKSSVTKEHGPLVLRDLLKQLAAFLAAYPTHGSARSMRMLHMVTQSYVLSTSSTAM